MSLEMEKEELEHPLEEEKINKNFESLEETKNWERNESLYGLTRAKICENCKYFGKLTPQGQSVRRCQACPKRKNSLEKTTSHEEFGNEGRFEDNSIAISTPNSVTQTNTKLEENSNDFIKDSHKENFTVELQSNDFLCANTKEGKVVSRKRDIVTVNRKEYNSLNLNDITSKKKNIECLKGRHWLDKDNTIANERKEQIVETLDVQKTKEEIELERRERGWNVNGSILGKSVNQSKASTLKSVVTIDGEQRDRIKFKSLKEKPDTQRILGLVAKRSESRLYSPSHRVPNLNYKKHEEEEAPYISNIKNTIAPSISIHEITSNPYASKSQETHSHEITTNSEIDPNYVESPPKWFYTNSPQVLRLCKFEEDSKSRFSSPTNLGCYTNENILLGTQHILELFAKKTGSGITSPSQRLEINEVKSGLNNIIYNELRELNKTRNSDVTFQSCKLFNQQIEHPKTTSGDSEDDLVQKNNTKISLDLDDELSSNAQFYMAQEDLERNKASLTNANYHSNDSQFYNTHHILGLIAQRSENSILSPQKCTYYNSRDKSLANTKGNQSNIVEVQNETTTSCPNKKQEATTSKITHSNSTLHNQNVKCRRNEGTPSKTLHLNVDLNTPKTNYEEDLSMSNSLELKFSRPSSTMCYVNDNPLYCAKFGSESTSCNTNNINESPLQTSNPIPNSPFVAHNSLDKPLKYSESGALDTSPKEIFSTLVLKSSSIYNSRDMTPLCLLEDKLRFEKF